MSEQGITTRISKGGVTAHFPTVDDFLLYVANVSTPKQFRDLHQQATGKPPVEASYWLLRRPSSRDRFLFTVAPNTKCSNGMSLLEAMKVIKTI